MVRSTQYPESVEEGLPDPSSNQTKSARAWMVAVGVIAIALAAWALRAVVTDPAIDPSVGTGDRGVASAFASEPEIDRLIAGYEARISEHTDSSDYRILGDLYLEKGRLSGDVSRYVAAAAAFERSVDLYPEHPDAHLGVAAAAYALHDFATSFAQSRRVYDATARVDALAVMADSALALGDYESAESLLDQLSILVPDAPAVLVRQAEWARINGDAAGARELAMAAVEAVAGGQNARQRAWYASFAAQTLLYLGEYDEARSLATSALNDDPTSHIAMITAARIDTALGNFEPAISAYESVTANLPEPTYLAELGALYEVTGNQAQADDVYATLDVGAALVNAEGVFDRAIALNLADRGELADTAVTLAEGELAERTDVGAFDAYAWTLLAAGSTEEAAEAATTAVSRGTLNASYWFHAGVAAFESGDPALARERLERALSLSPQFHPLQADEARDLLDSLR